MAWLVANGAIVSDSGEWYYVGLKWKALVASPRSPAPGFTSPESRQALALVSGSPAGGEVGKVGDELAQLIAVHGSLAAVEREVFGAPHLPEQAGPAPIAPTPEVQVKTYRSAQEYERDAPKMAAAGWMPQGQSSQQGRVAVGRTLGKAVLTGGLGLALTGRSRKADKITVTWVRAADV